MRKFNRCLCASNAWREAKLNINCKCTNSMFSFSLSAVVYVKFDSMRARERQRAKEGANETICSVRAVLFHCVLSPRSIFYFAQSFLSPFGIQFIQFFIAYAPLYIIYFFSIFSYVYFYSARDEAARGLCSGRPPVQLNSLPFNFLLNFAWVTENVPPLLTHFSSAAKHCSKLKYSRIAFIRRSSIHSFCCRLPKDCERRAQQWTSYQQMLGEGTEYNASMSGAKSVCVRTRRRSKCNCFPRSEGKSVCKHCAA